jgi:hypothetical protein
MFTIDVRLTLDEAISVLRAVAAKERTEPDPEKRDDLELIRLNFYHRIYHGRPETIRIDLGYVTDQSKGERQHAATVRAFRRLAA